MKNKLRVLAVGAHPDDPEIFCGGTLAKYAKQGHKVFMAYLTDGSAGALEGDRKKLAETRLKEGGNAAKLIKAELISLGLPDAELVDNLDNRLKVMDAVREAKPDIIITHPPHDQNPDHRIASALVKDASFMALARKLKTRHAPTDKIIPLYFMEPAKGIDFLPTEYVDITDVFDVKKKLFLQHKSQVAYLPKVSSGESPLNWMEIIARFRGFQVGVEYAEGFTQLMIAGGVTAERLLP